MKRRLLIIALLSTFLCIPCCGQKHQRGKASYYSKRATGARSASGQRIHHDSLTCAHRYYPFGTMLKVTNLRNDKSVIVEVIDRGPFGRGRIIDLSWAAAKKLDMISQGVATVKVERLDNPVPFKPEQTKLPKIDFEMAEFEPEHYFEKKEIAKEKTEAKIEAKEIGKEKTKEKTKEKEKAKAKEKAPQSSPYALNQRSSTEGKGKGQKLLALNKPAMLHASYKGKTFILTKEKSKN